MPIIYKTINNTIVVEAEINQIKYYEKENMK